MSRKPPPPKKPRRGGELHEPRTAEERARDLLLRLETSGPNPKNAAEELDRLQGKLERDGQLDDFRERLAELADAWADGTLRGERAHAWLTLVGGFVLQENVERVASLAEDTGLHAPLRIHACQVLPSLKGEVAVRALQSVLLSRTDPLVRAAAADGLALLGDRSVAPVLATLLDEDLPRNVWSAVSGAFDRLR